MTAALLPIALPGEREGFVSKDMLPVPDSLPRQHGPPGMLVYNSEYGERVLCAVCGNFYRHLGQHVRAHGLSARAYKVLVGLRQGDGLTALDVKARRVAIGHRLPPLAPYAVEASRKAVAARKRVTPSKRKTVAFQNGRHQCDNQIRHQIHALTLELGYAPSLKEIQTHLKLHPSYVRSIYSGCGHKGRPHVPLQKFSDARITALAGLRLCVTVMARVLQVSRGAVRRRLRRLGIPYARCANSRWSGHYCAVKELSLLGRWG